MRSQRRAALAASLLLLGATGAFWSSNTKVLGQKGARGGQVHGFVDAVLRGPEGVGTAGTLKIALPNAKVYLKRQTDGKITQSVRTNVHGYFMLPRHRPGSYQVCAEAPGFSQACDPNPITIANETVVMHNDLLLFPGDKGVVAGRALLRDGRACFQDSQMFGTFVVARVELERAGARVAGPAESNSLGQFVISPAPAAGAYELVATCESIKASRRVEVASSNRFAGAFYLLRFSNWSPTIYKTIPYSGGVAVRRAKPGDTLRVAVNAFDPDRDPLHYKWTDGTPGFPSVDSPSFKWTLPGTPATNILFVQVRDGKGGYAQDRVVIQATATPGVVFGGTITDNSTSRGIGGAVVSVNGKTTTTGTQGSFLLRAPESQRYVVNASKPGYAFHSEIAYNETEALRIRLDPTQTFSGIIPAVGGTFTYAGCERCRPKEGVGASVTIPPRSLVDGQGRAVTAPVRLDMYAYDISTPDPIPGDFSAKDSSGRDVRMETFGAADVQVTDGSGHVVGLAPGQEAEIRIQVQPAVLAKAPATIPFFSYDPQSGYWKYETDAHLIGSKYVAHVKHFSQFNADTVFTNTACIRFTVKDIDPNHIAPQLPFLLDASIPQQDGTVNHHNATITDFVNGVFRLPPNVPVTLIVRPLTDPNFTITTLTVNSGNPISNSYNGFPPFDYSACNGFDPASSAPGQPVVLTIPLPARAQQFLSIFATGASDAETKGYYQAVGALDATQQPTTQRSTFGAWKQLNGLSPNPSTPVAGEAEGIFYNNADLQLGRDMHCLQSGTKIACYVSNYSPTAAPGGDPQGSITEAIARGTPLATVAMEYDPSAANGQNVQFYAYRNDGSLFDNPALDSEGNKFIPQLCMACHGGTFTPGQPVVGASFLPFDTSSFTYDTSPAGYTLDNQQEQFRQLNYLVKSTNPNNTDANNPIGSLIAIWYPCGVANPGCTTSNLPTNPNPLPLLLVPSGWQTNAELYSTITQHRCRTCHVAQPSSLDWTSYSQWDPNFKALIQSYVCTNPGVHEMPHAEVPFKTFWTSTDPHEPEFLSGPAPGLNFGAGSCPP